MAARFPISMPTIYELFLIPFFVGAVIIPLLMLFSQKTGKVLDISAGDALKIHKTPTSLLGGLGMLLAMLAGLFFAGNSIFFIAAMLIIFGLGFWDDIFWKHTPPNPRLKFAALIICSFAAAAALGYSGIFIALAFAAIFIGINAVNYQDGMDGLAGGLCAISLVGFFLVGTSPIPLIALGAVAAFLVFNFPPAKVFMGDSGAYLLGFVLAVLALTVLKTSIIAPIFIVGLPLFDGVFTNLRRLAAKKSIFHGDRDHLYDKLLRHGFSTKKTLTICYFLQILLMLVGVSIKIYG